MLIWQRGVGEDGLNDLMRRIAAFFDTSTSTTTTSDTIMDATSSDNGALLPEASGGSASALFMSNRYYTLKVYSGLTPTYLLGR